MCSLYIKNPRQMEFLDEIVAQTSRTIDPSLASQIKNKYRTFSNFNYREAYKERKTARKRKQEDAKLNQNSIGEGLNALITLMEPKENKSQTKKIMVGQQLLGIKNEKRERFKKMNNTFHIIKHYIEKQDFKPKEEEMYLMKALAELKENSQQTSLDTLLKKIYKYMNEAVDFNEMRLLCLLVVLAADISYQHKDYNRAFYFYNQSKLFSSYSEMYHVKTQALMALGSICMEIRSYGQAIKIYKKSLQYSWKTKNVEHQLLIYDLLGSAYYYEGNLKESLYFHRRFTQGDSENNDSAIRKISIEMLGEYETYLSSLEKKNLTSLFIEYINIPIVGLHTVGIPEEAKRAYENYDEQCLSPRRKRGKKEMELSDVPDVMRQLQKLLEEDHEFRTEIPSPNLQQIFVPEQKFGRTRKHVVFENTAEYHTLSGHREKKNLSQIYCKSLEKRIVQALSERQNKDWWSQIKDKIRKSQLQKVGRLRDRIFNSHLSHYKYPEERRRSHSLKTEKIKQCFNKSLLDWIDPLN